MHILHRKCGHITLLGIKADRDALHCSNIVHSTFLIKIRKRNMPVFLVNLDGGDRVGTFWINASPFSRYRSLVRLIISSRVEPLNPLEFQVAIKVTSLSA